MYYIELITPWYQIYFTQVINILARFNKTKSFRWNTKNTNRNRVNKQTIHPRVTHREKWHCKRLFGVNISGTPFLEQPPILPTPPFLWKNLSRPFFGKFSKLTPPPPPPSPLLFIKGDSNYEGSMKYFFI